MKQAREAKALFFRYFQGSSFTDEFQKNLLFILQSFKPDVFEPVDALQWLTRFIRLSEAQEKVGRLQVIQDFSIKRSETLADFSQ